MSHYLAHSAPEGGDSQPMREHLSEVARLAEERAALFGKAEDARLAGLLHDVGKYSDRFLKRLKGRADQLDHWSAGAWLALTKHRSIPVALAIQGHHIGLQHGAKDDLYLLNPDTLAAAHPLGLTLTEVDTELLYQRLQADGFDLSVFPSKNSELKTTASAMLETRMLFSALVDADFLDTARHFGNPRVDGPKLEPERALAALERYMAEKIRSKLGDEIAEEVRALRETLWSSCLEKATGERGLWTLTAPTGSGKTLAMLAFGLHHAIKHTSLRRLVFVIPYLSIIDQTVQVYREIFEPEFGPAYVLDHHSLARWKQETEKRKDLDSEEAALRQQKLLAENWDAPIIVTTSVQMLESLFGNRPSVCRKLHALAQSIILFDEVQTLPQNLAIPTLKTLSRLAMPDFGASVVFATATQPAFANLDGIEEEGNQGWQPREIAPSSLFQLRRRVEVDWSRAGAEQTWEEIAAEIREQRQALCIVNMRKDAQTLVKALESVPGVWHLSTWMCPAHRAKTLEKVKALLDPKKPGECRLIATACVEAGVDLDFPLGYRAFAPLPSIAQAAGRVNRNGLRPVERLIVFLPKDAAYPDDHFVRGERIPGAYRQAADVTRTLLAQRGAERMQLDDPELFTCYYQLLYSTSEVKLNDEWDLALKRQDYVAVANLYQLIPHDTVQVLVPYRQDGSLAAYDSLAKEAREVGLTAKWIQRAKPLLVNLFRSQASGSHSAFLEPIVTRKGEAAADWFLYIGDPSDYDERIGLRLPSLDGFLGV